MVTKGERVGRDKLVVWDRHTHVTRDSQVVQVVKNLPIKAGDVGLIPGLGRSPGGGHGNPLQYSCLGNPMDRGAWQNTVLGVTKESDMT